MTESQVSQAFELHYNFGSSKSRITALLLQTVSIDLDAPPRRYHRVKISFCLRPRTETLHCHLLLLHCVIIFFSTHVSFTSGDQRGLIPSCSERRLLTSAARSMLLRSPSDNVVHGRYSSPMRTRHNANCPLHPQYSNFCCL